jgi:hypothetical protein
MVLSTSRTRPPAARTFTFSREVAGLRARTQVRARFFLDEPTALCARLIDTRAGTVRKGNRRMTILDDNGANRLIAKSYRHSEMNFLI